MKVEAVGHGKINLTLDILGKRQDGYHEVEMVMQSIELADKIAVELQEGISISSNHREVPLDETNLVYKVAMALKAYTNSPKGAHIHIEKYIPVAAGLAGGSTDGAAALVALNSLWKLSLSIEELMKIGASLGADIPFCLMEGTAIARGKGEELTPVEGMPTLDLVLVKPHFSVSTKEVYSKFNLDKVKTRPQTDQMLKAITTKNVELVLDSLCNVFEGVTFQMHPELEAIKQSLLRAGAKAALMSGSGPTIFAIAENAQKAEEIAAAVKGDNLDVIVTKTYHK